LILTKNTNLGPLCSGAVFKAGKIHDDLNRHRKTSAYDLPPSVVTRRQDEPEAVAARMVRANSFEYLHHFEYSNYSCVKYQVITEVKLKNSRGLEAARKYIFSS
jgi:hypothetical protein